MKPINIFIDTNLLILLCNVGDEAELDNAEFFAFEKSIYEYTNKFKQLIWNRTFLINCLNNKPINNLDISANYIEELKRIVIRAGTSAYFSKNELITALKRAYELRFGFAIAKEQIYQSDEEYTNLYKKYSFDSVPCDEGILHLFFKNLNIGFEGFIKRINDLIYNKVQILFYEEIFANSHLAFEIREIMNDTCLPSSDLEIVLASLYSGCSLFLSRDAKLIQSCRGLGLAAPIKFIHIDKTTDSEVINEMKGLIELYAE
jgi:hypothetical protein